MRGYEAYQQQTPSWTRIEMLIAAYDGVVSRLTKANELIVGGDEQAAQPLLVRAQRIITELYAGLDLKYGEIPENIRKIYLFALSRIGLGDELDLDAAINVITTIRAALYDIRDEAIELERNGLCHPTDHNARVLEKVMA